jgi:ribosomal protein L37AE/L43A
MMKITQLKLSRANKIAMIAVGALLVVWLGLTLFSASVSDKAGPGKVDDSVCPDCGRKWTSKAAQASGECNFCRAEKGAAYVPKKQRDSWTNSPTIPFTLLGLFVLLLAVHVGLLVRSRVKVPTEQALYHVNCGKCGRKLRYREKQIGHLARCPLCQKPLRFPSPPTAPRVSPWRKIRDFVWG